MCYVMMGMGKPENLTNTNTPLPPHLHRVPWILLFGVGTAGVDCHYLFSLQILLLVPYPII